MPLTSGGHNARTSRTRRHYVCRRPIPPRRRADLLEIVEDLARSAEALPRVKKARARAPEGPKAQELAALEARLSALNGRLATVYAILQDVDAAPTPAAIQAARELRQELAAASAAAP